MINLSGSMNAIRIHEYGSPEFLKLESLPIPEPKAGELLIRVEAVGLNFADTMRRKNQYIEATPLPYVLGGEVAGTVEKLGPGVQKFKIGEAVFSVTQAGGYAQYAVVNVDQTFPLLPGVDFTQATGIFIQGLTALLLIQNVAEVKKGQNVLIQGAAGGVGLLAVQFAKLAGANVVGLASSDEKLKLVKSFGADSVINYTKAGWPEEVKKLTGGRGCDVILEISGGKVLHESLQALGPFGQMIVYGNASSETTQVDPQFFVSANQTLRGFYLGGYFGHPEIIGPAIGELMSVIASKKIKLHIGEVLPLSQAAEAHRLLEGRKTSGKVVLKPWEG